MANRTVGLLKMPNHCILGDTMLRTVFTVASTFGTDVEDGGAATIGAGAGAGAGATAGVAIAGVGALGAEAVEGADSNASIGGRIASRIGLHDASAGISNRAPSDTNHTRWREIAEPRSIARVTTSAASNTTVAFARIMSTERPAVAVSPENPENMAGIFLYLPLIRARRILSRSRSTSPSLMSASDIRRSAVTACSVEPPK